MENIPMETKTKQLKMQINSLDADGDDSYLFVFTIPDITEDNWAIVKKIIHDAASDWAKSDFKSFRDSTELRNQIEGNPSAEEIVEKYFCVNQIHEIPKEIMERHGFYEIEPDDSVGLYNGKPMFTNEEDEEEED